VRTVMLVNFSRAMNLNFMALALRYLTLGAEISRGGVSRPSLGQTGAGHFSPIAAWHDASDMALVLDTARFKYPPFWAPIAKVAHLKLLVYEAVSY
jgi:hypothetical protein